jgi:hypothetical protein
LSRPRRRTEISQEYPYYVLIECLGSDQERDAQRFSNALESAMEKGLVVDAAVAQSGADCAAFWSLRDGLPALHYVLFALPPVTSRRMPGVISFTPPARDPMER